MFSFFKKAAMKEHAKLIYQNSTAVHFVRAFDRELAASVEQQVSAICATWTPGTLLEADHADLMLKANKALRRAYDQTPARHVKSFDEEYTPLLGWKEYLKNTKGDL